MTFTVIVDDSDPGILYNGPWANVNPKTLNPNEFGITTTLGNTLHNSSLSEKNIDNSFSYTFTGI